MKTMYKDGKECQAEKDQVALMEKAGWSLEKPEPADKPADKAPQKSAAGK